MYYNWTLFVILIILFLFSATSAISNIINYIRNKGGEFRFLYICLTLVFALMASSMADTLFK